MGSARWDDKKWAGYSSATSSKPRTEIFTSSHMKDDLNPLKITVRESVDSDLNPNSTPVILACDVTGSMGSLAERIVKHGLGVVMQEIIDHKPVSDPHLCVMAIGDTYCDSAPLQVTQFEADLTIAKQVEDIYLEGGGGGNDGESYLAAHYFAAFKIKADAIIKRKQKGFIFTIGDEPPLALLPKEHIKRVFGDDVQQDFSAKDLIDILSPNWHVFHIKVKPETYEHGVARWRELLGERCIILKDPDHLAEVIASTMRLVAGHSVDDVLKSWSGDTALVVRDSVGHLTKTAGDAGVQRL